MTPFPFRLIVVRHGETSYNAENRLQGQRDIPLNARGRDQASAIGRTLRAGLGAEIDKLEAAEASSLRRSNARERRWSFCAPRWASRPNAIVSTRRWSNSPSARGRA